MKALVYDEHNLGVNGLYGIAIYFEDDGKELGGTTVIHVPILRGADPADEEKKARELARRLVACWNTALDLDLSVLETLAEIKDTPGRRPA